MTDKHYCVGFSCFFVFGVSISFCYEDKYNKYKALWIRNCRQNC